MSIKLQKKNLFYSFKRRKHSHLEVGEVGGGLNHFSAHAKSNESYTSRIFTHHLYYFQSVINSKHLTCLRVEKDRGLFKFF